MKLPIFDTRMTEAILLPNSEALPDGGALPDSTRFSVKLNRYGQGFGGFTPIYRRMVIYRCFVVHTKQCIINDTMIYLTFVAVDCCIEGHTYDTRLAPPSGGCRQPFTTPSPSNHLPTADNHSLHLPPQITFQLPTTIHYTFPLKSPSNSEVYPDLGSAVTEQIYRHCSTSYCLHVWLAFLPVHHEYDS